MRDRRFDLQTFIDKSEAVAVMRAAVPDLVAAIRAVERPDAPGIGTWSVRDIAAHLVDVVEDHQNVVRGRGTAVDTTEQIAAHNQTKLEERGRADMSTIADLYEREINAYLDFVDALDEDPLVPYADFKMPVSSLIAADIAEVLMHGYDITKAEGKPWRIDAHHAALAGRGISPLTMSYVDKTAAAGLKTCFEVKLRGEWRLHFLFDDGELSIEEPSDRRVDVHISAAPVPFMLVGYGRISQWGPIAKGQIVTWGRKPWLALRFAKLLRNP